MQVPEAEPLTSATTPIPVLAVRHLVKTFGPVRAVDNVDLDIFPREIVSIIGDNGAGKSTFLSLLTGYHHADSGQFLYRGHPVTISSPQESRHKLRMEMIHQNLRLAPDLKVSENLFLGEELRRFGIFLDKKEMQRAAAEILIKLKVKVKPTDVLGHLSGGEQQAVAIGRALLFDRDIILMDEPTAAISVNKVQDILRTILNLKEHGKTVVLVTHRLEDVLEVSDRVVVFFHGRIREVVANTGLQISDLVHIMFDSSRQDR